MSNLWHVAEDYTSSCDAIATNTDTEEEITLVLLPRVMELAKFLLSVSLLDLHTKADGQRLVSEYIALWKLCMSLEVLWPRYLLS